METAILGDRERWSLGRVSNTSLLLAFFVPALGIAFGSANGVPLDRLGGVMFVYWIFLLVSLLAAIWDFLGSGLSPKAARRLAIVAVIAAAPVTAKAVVVATQPAVAVQTAPVVEAPSAQKTATAKGCQPEIVTRQPLAVSDDKTGRAGRLAWVFLIGNYYKWDFHLNIMGDNGGATGKAWADVEASAWYSVRIHPNHIQATGRGNVECRPTGDKCDCFADGDSKNDSHEDFVVNVDVQSAAAPPGATLKVSASASVAGNSAALSEISLGKEPLGGKWQNPSTAHAGFSITKSYSYRCVAVP